MRYHLHIAGVLTLLGLFALAESPRLLQIPSPKLLSPANGAVMDNGCSDKSNGITWDFDWSDVPGATAYHIRVWRNPALPVINRMNVATSDYHYDSPQTYVINSNLAGWRWRVRAKVGATWGPWSRTGFISVERLNTDCR
ncbi:MAG: hypothetical protein QOJ64_2288 [Acidobacteriota bacterium]|nr:hypothetical protein [Acidobacteriota bacterium]